ncbi:hypothetical protein CCAX7_34530 [Capsulimonas corticalis]|uniref:Uncharacterized protein n=1 Tax=Capsulimonas corticalis TaxID=2219043 RepID=A0A402CYB4_9BACT|nr:hypothetical protein [Capsulimonas corticalis]BDI31402.1 hypothetical protein CCAX7_34530 [Capsulimonas corticalis]
MAAKVCPRCGAQYASLKSATCPTCFAKLITVDDETAREMAAVRAEIENSEEFQEAKEVDDEQFRQQSFGACLGVVGITFLTLIVAIVLIVVAVKRYGHHPAAATRAAGPIAKGAPGDPLTELPVTGAKLADVMPPKMAPFERTEMDQDTVLSGTLTPIYHAAYRQGAAAAPAIDLYAIPTGQPTPEQNAFRTSIALVTHIGGGPPRPMLIFATQHWRYAAVGQAQAGAPPLQDLSSSLKTYFSTL